MNVRPHVAQKHHPSSWLLGDRSSYHTPRRLHRQSTDPKADRGGVRLDEERRRHATAMLRGTDRVGWAFTFAAAAYNLVRLPKLMDASA